VTVEIDPYRLYPFAEAARLIPSCQAGKRLNLKTLHRWRLAGKVKAVARESRDRRYWFLPGHEVARLINCESPIEAPASASDLDATMRALKAMGI
jgi:hypothetical protein